MARIRTYSLDSAINLEDKLIGTDIDDSGATKNYKIGDIKDFVLTFVDSGATGTGTTGFLPMWTDGAAGVLGNSIVKEAVDPGGGAYSTTKTLDVNGVINQINLGDSIGIGEGALANGDSTTLGENVAIGKNALNSLTTGTNNVAIGVDTLGNETTGRNNIAIGKKALELGAGNSNIGLGFKALYASDVGNDNVVIGNTSLK